ncbi:MAG TPA: stage V sporulation protein AD [Clostridiales bacterium]|nr:MAG: stage V sporulation protein AD [Candidatus Margulisbacteria bacterium GWF2_35_9]HAN21482.1 stage V sporulation protein AD [Clostridiales bacterium]
MKSILRFSGVYLAETATTVGKKESEGPLSDFFDSHEEDVYFGTDSFEKAESEMVRRTLNILLGKANKKPEDISLILGGDLLNQCVATSFAVSKSQIPFLGLYGACSTIIESAIVASSFINGGLVDNAAILASSHFCTAERQYRFPLEYGSQKTPTSQNTVTGCGSYLLQNEQTSFRVREAVVGKIVDNGIKDANNMGAAMATAAVDTILRYFNESGAKPDDFDMIATGDLGIEGHEISLELLKRCGLNLGQNYTDCGMLIYDIQKQDMQAGASGCACMATVFGGYLFKRMKRNELRNVLLIGTGALLNRNSTLQNESIPSIAHLIHIVREEI